MESVKRTKAEQKFIEAVRDVVLLALFVGILIGVVIGALLWA